MIVYADVVFLKNFIFDLEILLILLRLSTRKPPFLRLLLSACLGGAQGLFVFFPYFRILCALPVGLFVPLAMVYIVFFPCSMTECVRAWLIFLAAAFIYSGAMSFFGIKQMYGTLLLIPVCLLTDAVKRAAGKKKACAELIYNGKSVKTYGFWDSGNLLRYRDTPVILGNQVIFEKMFGEGFSVSAVCEWADAEDICAVPYSSLGSSGAVIGIRLDRAVIDGRKYDKIILGYFSDNFSEDLILNGTMT